MHHCCKYPFCLSSLLCSGVSVVGRLPAVYRGIISRAVISGAIYRLGNDVERIVLVRLHDVWKFNVDGMAFGAAQTPKAKRKGFTAVGNHVPFSAVTYIQRNVAGGAEWFLVIIHVVNLVVTENFVVSGYYHW